MRRRRLRGASLSGTRIVTSPWSPTVNGCTDSESRERTTDGMP